MAISPKDRYPGQIDTTSDPTGYPEGAARNVSVPGDGTGTPWEQDLVNDLLGWQQALLDYDGAAPSGTPEKVGASQYLDAIEQIATDKAAAAITDLESLVRDDLAGSRGAFLHASRGKPAWDSVAARPHWELASSAGAAFDVMEAYSNTGVLQFSFTPGAELPFQCTVTAVRAWVTPAAARTGTDRMSLRYATLPDLVPSVSSPEYDDESDSLQPITISGLSIPLVGTDTSVYPPGQPLGLLVTVRAGADSAPVGDHVHLVEVRYTLEIL